MSENSYKNQNDKSLIDIFRNIKDTYHLLLKKWVIITICGLGGGLLGLLASFILKPTYEAKLSFALVEKSAGGGLADLASTFGLSGFLGGNQSAFSGDNLLEIMKSKYAIEKTLLTPVEFNGKTKNLIEVYIDYNNLRKKWAGNTKKPYLKDLSYPAGQERETFTRVQDSILFMIYEKIRKNKDLIVVRKDKRVDIVNISFFSKNEQFSKLFIENLIDQTYRFYKESKTAQNLTNIRMMEHTADSIRNLYDAAMYKGAEISAININPAFQTAVVPRLKQESDAKLYGTVYAEVLKNLETLKLDMARETPIMQIIDMPRLPLEKKRLGHIMGVLLGGFLGGLLIVSYLTLSMKIKYVLKVQSEMVDSSKEE